MDRDDLGGLRMTSSSQEGARELRVVAMGGGTGLSTLLRGLKRYVPMRERRKRSREQDGAW